MEYPNIELIVKHDTTKEGKVFSEKAYEAMRNQLSNLIRAPFIRRVENIWCDNEEHHPRLTKIMINADDHKYEVTEVCCQDYKKKLLEGLSGVEEEIN